MSKFSIHTLIPGTLIPGSWTLNRADPHRAWFLDRGYWTVLMLQHPEPWSLVLGAWIAAIGPDPWGVMQNTISCVVVVDIELQQTQHLVFMVHDPWSLIPGPWSLIPGPWIVVHGPWIVVHGSWSRSHPPRTPHPLYMLCVCRWLKAEFLRLITINFFYFFIKVLYFCLNSVLHCLWKKGIL